MGLWGGYHKCPIPFNTHVKIRLYDVCWFYVEDHLYPFFNYDYMLKVRLRMQEARKVVEVQNLSEPLDGQSDLYSVYGTDITGSSWVAEFWRSFGLDFLPL